MDCLKCEKEIVETMIQENGSGWMRLGEKKFMHDGENQYVRCPYCKFESFVMVNSLN